MAMTTLLDSKQPNVYPFTGRDWDQTIARDHYYFTRKWILFRF